MEILNKSYVRDCMKDKPKGQNIYKAFEGNWDLLTDNELSQIYEILLKDFSSILTDVKIQMTERGIIFA